MPEFFDDVWRFASELQAQRLVGESPGFSVAVSRPKGHHELTLYPGSLIKALEQITSLRSL